MSHRHVARRAVVLGIAAIAVLSACGGNGKTKATQKTFPTANQPSPAIVDLNQLLDDEGVLTVPAAQRLFAAYVAPLPGVEPLVLPAPAPDGIATLATRRLSPGAPGVTPEVQASVEAALATPEGETVEIAPGGPGRARSVEGPLLDEVRREVLAIRDGIQDRTGYRLTNPIQVRIVSDRASGGSAITRPVGEPSRTVPCRITLPRSGADGSAYSGDAASVTSLLAHEVWHCFQLSASPATWVTAPSWMAEGQAEFAGEAYVGGSGSAQGSWDTWLLTPTSSLFRRSYDAIGIYALAQARGADPWRTMLPMLGKNNVGAVEELFGKGSAEIMKADAQSLVRAARFGAEWETTGPGVTGARASNALDIAADKPTTSRVDLGRYSGLPVEITSAPGDILVLEFTGGAGGAVAFPGAGTVPVEPGGRVQFCMRDKPCACPDGTQPGGGGELARITGREGVAAIGATAAGPVSVTGRILSLDQACAKLVGSWEADLGALIAANAQVGVALPAGFRCTGPVTLTFTAEGAFTERGQGVCDPGGANINVQWGGAGKYTANGFEITFERTSCTGLLKTLCFPSGTLGYRIEGTTLFIEQRAPGGIVTKSYTRVA